MNKLQPVIDWFTDRGGKYCGEIAPINESDVDTSEATNAEPSDTYAEVGVCTMSDELFNYLCKNGPPPKIWAELQADDEGDEEEFESSAQNEPFNPDVDSTPDEVDRSPLAEIKYRGMQIFVGEIMYEDDTSTVSVQFLLDHGRDDDDHAALNSAVESLKPLLPEKSEFELSFSLGTDVFLLRDLTEGDLEPEKLDEILTPLTKFAEFATTKISILHTAPEFKLKKQHSD